MDQIPGFGVRSRHFMRPLLITAAVLVYAILAGCALWGGSADAQQDAGGGSGNAGNGEAGPAATRALEPGMLPIRAVGIQLQRTDWMEEYKKSIDEVADIGAEAVKFVVDARQEDGASNRIYIDLRMTPSADQLSDLIRYAKGKGLKVILMPIVLLDDPKGDEWRGTLKPESWAEWFDSYREVLGHFLWIAEANDVDIFVIGSELVSSERQAAEWDRTITFIRGRFSGLLTYSSNWDHYEKIPFWEKLDLIGMNSYWTLGPDEDTSVETIKANWQDIQAELRPFIEQKNKPLLFLEIGWCSLDNAAKEPWDYTKDVPVNLELQRRLYQGFFESWHGTPWLGGFSVWEWPPGDGGPTDRGYTPENKPAEDVLREWMAKPDWEVAVN
jgi:hypothetical protein